MSYLKCYQVLGLPPGATLRQIHRAYKRLVLRHHPDRTAGDAVSLALFCEVTEAYSTLKRAFALREVAKNAGPCGKCERIAQLYRALDGNRYCSDCLLSHRRRFLPLPTFEQIKCMGVIALQALAIYCVSVSILYGDMHHGVVALLLILGALALMAFDFWRADVIDR